MRKVITSRHGRVAWIVLALSLAATTAGWQFTRQVVEEGHRMRFENRMNSMSAAIRGRLAIYVLALRAGAAHFNASDNVTRAEWRTYVKSMDIASNYPGIQGLGFAAVVRPEQLEAHVRAVRAEGFPDYHVWPAADGQVYSSIVYLEPFDWRNQRAFGYDMYSEPVRRAAMEEARDSAEPAASAKVELVQETESAPQAGFLIYVPVYEYGSAPETISQRRQLLKGWVYSPFRADDLMRGIYGSDPRDIHVQIYDGAVERDNLLHDSARAGASQAASGHPARQGRLEIPVAQRRWTLVFTSLPAFEATGDARTPAVVLVAGILASLLLFVTAAAYAARRQSLVELFDATQRSLEEKEVLLREIHHRVKNSLQIVVSMLTMQALKTPEEAVSAALHEAVSRVRAIAKIHEHLYGSEDIARVDFGRYLTAIAADFAQSTAEYVLRVKPHHINLPTEQAVPLALIFVELVTNAVKHADAPLEQRVIDVDLTQAENGDLELAVRDYGVGLPEGFALSKAKTGLGARTMLALCLQLNAELTFENAEPGTRWRLRLPLAKG